MSSCIMLAWRYYTNLQIFFFKRHYTSDIGKLTQKVIATDQLTDVVQSTAKVQV